MASTTHLLGSAILAASRDQPLSLPTGCSSIDQALDGGLEYGMITSLAGANQADKTLFALHAVASHLLTNCEGDVAFIYTSESSLPIQLHDVLCERYEARELGATVENSDGTEAIVSRMLERVRLMRAFDLIGVLESIGEISEAWSSVERAKYCASNLPRIALGEVPSSQDDDLETISDDEHQLEGDLGLQRAKGIDLIVVDSIASVLANELSKDQLEGQALMTSFCRSLHNLTTHYRICTLILNSSVSSHPQNTGARNSEGGVSRFRSVQGKPGLGQNYGHLIDVSVFLSDLPKSRHDTEAAYARSGSYYSTAKVVEVLDDRVACREGQWGAFEIQRGSLLCPLD